MTPEEALTEAQYILSRRELLVSSDRYREILRALIGHLDNATNGVSTSPEALGAQWISVAERLPCIFGEQADVLFGSPHWGWPVVGMFTNFGSEHEWSEYDQLNDKYVLWESEAPLFWMPKPKSPRATD